MKRFALTSLVLFTLLSLPALAAEKEPASLPEPSPEVKQQIAAILQIEEKGQPTADDVAKLIEALNSESPNVRAYAADALGKCGDAAKPAVEALVKRLADAHPVVRREAAQSLWAIRPGPKVTRPLVKKLLKDADPGVRTMILSAIADLGKPIVPALIDALKDDEADDYACLVLREIGPDAAEAAPTLVERLKAEQRPEVRQQMILALGAIGSPKGVPALVEVLDNPQEPARVPAAFALGQIGPQAKEAQPALTKAGQSDDPVLPVVAAWALAKIAPEDEAVKDRSFAVLAKAVMGKNPLARMAAMRALADLRPGPAKMLPLIKKVVEGPDKAAAAEALHSLGSMGEAAVPSLIRGLQLGEHRPLVASILAHIGPPAKAAVPALTEIVKTDKNPHARREALLALGAIGEASAPAVPAIEAALSDSDVKVVLAACYALGKLGPAAKDAAPALKKLAEDKDATVRKAAEDALAAVQ